MSERLYRAILENESELVNGILQQLKRSTSQHYVEMDWERLVNRIESLVSHFAMSLRAKPALFVEYVVEAAQARIDGGFRLGELLMALRLLEEKAWKITAESVPLEDQVRLLARVTGTIGAAKDRLSESYVEYMREREEAARSWRRCAESAPEAGDDRLENKDLANRGA